MRGEIDMNNSERISRILEDNWEEVRDKMGNAWRKLTEKDMKGIKNFNDLVKKMMIAYEISEEAAEQKINDFIEKHSLEVNFSRLEELKNALQESANIAKTKIKDTVKNSVDATRESTEELTEYFKDKSEVLTSYVQDNPLKVLGLGVIAGIAIKKLLFNK